MLVDSGARRNFESGAVRDIAEGKGRCDLLPLKAVYKFIAREEIIHINNYIQTGEIESLCQAVISFVLQDDSYTDIITAILEVSKQYEEGAIKYSDRNWEKGIPVHCYIDSAIRHFLKYLRADEDEHHDRAFIWNILGAMWTHENKPELIDLPFKERL